MPEFTVHGVGSVSVSMTFKLTDDEIKNKDNEDIVDIILDKFYEEVPDSICAQCSGWGEKWSRDVDGEYEYTITDANHVEVYANDRLKGSFAECDKNDGSSS